MSSCSNMREVSFMSLGYLGETRHPRLLSLIGQPSPPTLTLQGCTRDVTQAGGRFAHGLTSGAMEVWQDIDRKSFFENAILVEARCRSQGIHVKSKATDARRLQTAQPDEMYPFQVRDFLDDLSLVASGGGGADNVCAACLEVTDRAHLIMVLRLARNAGVKEGFAQEVESILNQVVAAYDNGKTALLHCYQTLTETETAEETVRQLIIGRVLIRCQARLKKHTAILQGALRRLQDDHCNPELSIPYMEHGDTVTPSESFEDTQILGDYDQATHRAFLRLQIHRLHEIKRLSNRVGRRTFEASSEDFRLLMHLAYRVRKSTLFRRLVRHNAAGGPHAKANMLLASEVIERLGQLSKFARAAITITKHLKRMLKRDITLRVTGAPSRLIQVRELAQTTPEQLRARGSTSCTNLTDAQLSGMLARWSMYREHVEIQLILFYIENPHIILHDWYIGCNKLSCFLCFHFVQQMGRFYVGGCHQSLYSLWTVRESINSRNPAEIAGVRTSIQAVSSALNGVFETLQGAASKTRKGGHGKESIADLSRISIDSDDNDGDDFCDESNSRADDESQLAKGQTLSEQTPPIAYPETIDPSTAAHSSVALCGDKPPGRIVRTMNAVAHSNKHVIYEAGRQKTTRRHGEGTLFARRRSSTNDPPTSQRKRKKRYITGHRPPTQVVSSQQRIKELRRCCHQASETVADRSHRTTNVQKARKIRRTRYIRTKTTEGNVTKQFLRRTASVARRVVQVATEELFGSTQRKKG